MIAAKWGRKDEAALIARVADAESDAAWRVFPFRPKPQPPEEKTEIATLKDCCYETASSVEGKPENFYLICVDALQARRGVVTLSCEKPDRATCSMQRDLLDAGRDFFVNVWTAAGAIADVKLSGTAGDDPIYDPKRTDGAKALDESKDEEKEQEVQWLEPFSPRKPGTAKLNVTVTRDGEPFPVEKDYTIRGSYRVAIRLGVGISWAPWAREVGIRTVWPRVFSAPKQSPRPPQRE